jgi:lipopolysaccharide/colanic/teichoic acid biosynthesis glycosyltransferase
MMRRRKNPLIWFDLLLLGLSYVLVTLMKPSTRSYFSEKYLIGLGIMMAIWFIITVLFRKFRPNNPPSNSVTLHVFFVNLLTLGIITIAMYGARKYEYSRFIVFGTIALTTVMEIITSKIHRLLVQNGNGAVMVSKKKKKKKMTVEAAMKEAIHEVRIRDISLSVSQLKEDISEECGEDAYNFISENIDLLDPKNVVVSTTTRFNILYQPVNYLNGIVNLKRVNDIRYLNKFFEAVSMKLPDGGRFIGCGETKNMRKERILKKYPPALNWIYYFFDYLVKRIFPKFNLTKKIYFILTRGENRVLTRAEILGRLYSCGFNIESEAFVNGQFFYVARKVKEPAYDMSPTYGALVKLRRMGQDGKMIRVYKMRTMHPFSEYLQDYVYQKHNLREGGKFNNDFRISSAGRIMRALWIDELPTLVNWMRGDLKLVGVRPITEQYFNLYSKEHQQRRIKYKPGLIPPFYADLPKTLEEIEASEKKYLDAWDQHPFRTDWRYFWKAIYNIVFRHARSK